MLTKKSTSGRVYLDFCFKLKLLEAFYRHNKLILESKRPNVPDMNRQIDLFKI